jgi:hypothetical protein
VPSSASTDMAAVTSASRSSSSRSCTARTSIPSMPSVPLMRARPSLARSVTGGGRPAAARRPPARPAPGRPHLTLADERERAVGQRSQVAAGAERPVLTHHRRDAGAEHGQLQVHQLGASARVAHGQAAGPQQQHRPNHLPLHGGPIPAACERTSDTWSSAVRAAGITVVASEPNPVVTPYTGWSPATMRSTSAADLPMASRARSSRVPVRRGGPPRPRRRSGGQVPARPPSGLPSRGKLRRCGDRRARGPCGAGRSIVPRRPPTRGVRSAP